MKKKYSANKQGLYDPRFEHDSCGVGFLCHVKGEKSFNVLKKSLEALKRLSHRGAVGSDPETGDGAGVLIQMPHKFLRQECFKVGISLPPCGAYAAGLVFLPVNSKEKNFCLQVCERIIREEGQIFLGWRKVPVDEAIIGKTARRTKPDIYQLFAQKNTNLKSQLDFERKLYVIRRRIENIIRYSELDHEARFHIVSLSARTITYKGLLMPKQIDEFFIDLKDKRLETSICIFHSRYSTNTFPDWDLAQPFRFLAHNGEINTLQGNINWMRAREGMLKSELFGDDIEKIKPVIIPKGSDSAALDNVFELLVLSGRSLAQAMMMLIPADWEGNNLIEKKLKDFYKYQACLIEPWDGPAAVAFTDGRCIAAVLDRNGLRPARYIVTKDGLVIMASEAGVLDIEAGNIEVSGRIEPGKIFFIDTDQQKIIKDDEIKTMVSNSRPYGKWIKKNMLSLNKLSMPSVKKDGLKDTFRLLKAFGYTREDLKVILGPMAEEAKEPAGSMGDDVPHAVLSARPRLIYDYFKQLFAQVTNPAIDPIRESLVMSLEIFIGQQGNLLGETPRHVRLLEIEEPVISNMDLLKIQHISKKGFKAKTISVIFKVSEDQSFINKLNSICRQAQSAVEEGCNLIILSDRGVNADMAALPALLAAGAVHQFLLGCGLRTKTGIIVESAQPREVHHFALLFGYGADCINPYLAYDALEYMIENEMLQLKLEEAIANYRIALHQGILKILSKMGISTLRSYRGAQIFEAVGLDKDVIEQCFAGTVSRLGGAGLDIIAQETVLRHGQAYASPKEVSEPYLSTGGVYQWKRDGEFHLWNPESIVALQNAARENNYDKYKEFAQFINDQSQHPATLRSLLKIIFKDENAVDLNEVEPVEEIVKRFVTGAMSFGSISRGAHETLALAMNKMGARSNTGEGGEDPARFLPLPNGDSLRSAVKQVASGRFGVTTNYLVNADELQIKIAQGAKPGEGGQLPGHKVSEIIAYTRCTTPGVTLISPPPHHDIYSIEDLAQLIFDLKNVNPSARISVKLVSEAGVGTIAAGVAKGHADMILISGGDGGTGASALSSIKHAGLPWELGLSETHQTLLLNDLRSRVRLQTDGGMRTGRDVAIAALLGAEEYGFSTAPLIVMGCLMLRHCHLNNCALGIATQDEILQKKFKGKAEHIINYFHFVAGELREIMAKLGLKTVNEMIGRTDLLQLNKEILPWKAKKIDYSKILYRPKNLGSTGRYYQARHNHDISDVMDVKLIKAVKEALDKKTKNIKIELDITNENRTTGAMLCGELCRGYGEKFFAEDAIHCKFKGTAGQSFGSFLIKGVTFELEGLANDYAGKSLCGGKIVIYPYKEANYEADKNVIIGNTAFYGAVSGEAYICGTAGERFCVRNSGIHAVVEGTGDHACEYMTGGRVLVLGGTGRNFAAGMSGGIAYVYDEKKDFYRKCNLEMADLEIPAEDDKELIQSLLAKHYQYTKSPKAERLLGGFKREFKRFVKVMPREYKRILESKNLEKN